MLEAIKYKRGKLLILDQLALPQKTIYKEILTVVDAFDAITSMKVRGAPAISIVAALSLAIELEDECFAKKNYIHEFIIDACELLASSRPTAVNLKQVIDAVVDLSRACLQDDRMTPEDMKFKLLGALESLLEADININKAIGKYGGEYLCRMFGDQPLTVLTHCNTGSLATAGYGTALGVIRWLNENNKLHHGYCTETRPYNQGARLTAYELVHDKIPATLVCDGMVAALMKTKQISAIVVGADRVVANGDTANKIGTYQIAVCAKHHGIPFFVASPRSTIDFSLENGSQIPIEERPAREMTSINSIPVAAEGIQCWNPAFDVTPAELITGGIITDCGVFPAHSLKEHKDLLSSFKLFSEI